MRKSMLHYVCLIVLCGTFGAVAADADPLTVTSGQLVGTLVNGNFLLNGSGFSLGGVIEGLPASAVFRCSPCTPSLSESLSATALVNGGPAFDPSGKYNGVTYPSLTLGFNLMFTATSFNSTDLSP